MWKRLFALSNLAIVAVACGGSPIAPVAVMPPIPVNVPVGTATPTAQAPGLPTVQISGPASQVYAGDSVEFTVIVQAPAGLDHLFWTFGDGASAVAGKATTHVYLKAGRYAASVEVYDLRGNQTSSALAYVNVLETQVTPPPYVPPTPPPAPVIPPVDMVSVGNVITTVGVSTTFKAKVIGQPQITGYTWAFGDGMSLTTQIPQTTHTYGFTGAYTLTLTTYDEYGRVVAVTSNVTVN